MRNEYAPLSDLLSMQGLFDDEAVEAIQHVSDVGDEESLKLDEKTDKTEEERKQITEDINKEIDKLSSGLETLKKASNLEFGRSAAELATTEYKKQIQKFKDLIGELDPSSSDSGRVSESVASGSNFEFQETSSVDDNREEGANPLRPQYLYSSGSEEYTGIIDSLNAGGVAYNVIAQYQGERSNDEIIMRISGGDMTQGSCSSLALAYVGNIAGYDVLDFRDGKSRDFFSSRSSIQHVASLPGVQSVIYEGRNDIVTARQLLDLTAPGKEYYLATGQHAAIVRRNGADYEYLELQHPSDGNGWHSLDENILRARFGCQSMHLSNYSNYLIEVESLSNSREFLSILGYINTSEYEQRKGSAGNVR